MVTEVMLVAILVLPGHTAVVENWLVLEGNGSSRRVLGNWKVGGAVHCN